MRHLYATIAACALVACAVGYRAITGEAGAAPSGASSWALLTFAVSAFGGRLR